LNNVWERDEILQRMSDARPPHCCPAGHPLVVPSNAKIWYRVEIPHDMKKGDNFQVQIDRRLVTTLSTKQILEGQAYKERTVRAGQICQFQTQTYQILIPEEINSDDNSFLAQAGDQVVRITLSRPHVPRQKVCIVVPHSVQLVSGPIRMVSSSSRDTKQDSRKNTKGQGSLRFTPFWKSKRKNANVNSSKPKPATKPSMRLEHPPDQELVDGNIRCIKCGIDAIQLRQQILYGSGQSVFVNGVCRCHGGSTCSSSTGRVGCAEYPDFALCTTCYKHFDRTGSPSQTDPWSTLSAMACWIAAQTFRRALDFDHMHLGGSFDDDEKKEYLPNSFRQRKSQPYDGDGTELAIPPGARLKIIHSSGLQRRIKAIEADRQKQLQAVTLEENGDTTSDRHGITPAEENDEDLWFPREVDRIVGEEDGITATELWDTMTNQFFAKSQLLTRSRLISFQVTEVILMQDEASLID